jgi:hypothetical protein
MIWIHQLLAHTDDVNLIKNNIDTMSIKKHAETLIDAFGDVGLEANVKQLSMYCCLIIKIQVKIMT